MRKLKQVQFNYKTEELLVINLELTLKGNLESTTDTRALRIAYGVFLIPGIIRKRKLATVFLIFQSIFGKYLLFVESKLTLGL